MGWVEEGWANGEMDGWVDGFHSEDIVVLLQSQYLFRLLHKCVLFIVFPCFLLPSFPPVFSFCFIFYLFFILVAQAFIQWLESGEVGVKLTDQFLITVKSGGDQRGNIMRGRHMH